uniref:Uncharacterized protein n=1 Tax=Arundo donax TaxID=35708 RepID=A0A0A8Y8H8_ARUDO
MEIVQFAQRILKSYKAITCSLKMKNAIISSSKASEKEMTYNKIP